MPFEHDGVMYTGIGAAALTIGGLLIRFLISSVRTERLAHIAAGADVGSYARMQLEIKRLADKVDELEKKVETLKNALIADTYEVASLASLLMQMPCGKCDTSADVFRAAERAAKNIVERRRNVAGDGGL